MALEIVPVEAITTQVAAHLTSYMVTNGTSDLAEIITHRTFIPDLDNYGSLTLTRQLPDIKNSTQEIRYTLVVIFKHDNAEASRAAAELNIARAITDFTHLLADSHADRPSTLYGDLLRIYQVQMTSTPPAPKYNADLRWAFFPIQVDAKLWRVAGD